MISDGDFPKEERLIKTGNFRNAYKKGSSIKLGGFSVYRVENPDGKRRIGFSISSRVIKLSTRRNRIRRILKEVYRRNKTSIKNGLDIVVVVRRPFAATVSYDEIEGTLLSIFKKSGMMI